MRPRNRDGTPVDPVPFLVVAGLSFLLIFSFGPLYAGAVGLSLPLGLWLSAGLFVVTAAAAYVRFVWQAPPDDLRGEVPADRRFARLLYATLCLALLVVLLSLPLL
jgi:hypothetical protein